MNMIILFSIYAYVLAMFSKIMRKNISILICNLIATLITLLEIACNFHGSYACNFHGSYLSSDSLIQIMHIIIYVLIFINLSYISYKTNNEFKVFILKIKNKFK